jgi:cytochrome c
MICMKVFSIAFAGLIFIAASAQAGDAKLGKEFVEKNCTPCHAVGTTGDSPNPKAPPFREVAKRYDPRDLEEAFSEGIMVAHDAPMPQFELEPDQIEDLISYLQSLRK